jgi:peptide deformylase
VNGTVAPVDREDDLRVGGTVLPIVRWGAPVMHTKTRPVTAFNESLHPLIRDMFATMYAAEGVGLAATQVDADLAVFVFDCPGDDQVRHVGVICNPEIVLPEGRDRKLEAADEGCLSLPGAYIELARPDHAICRGLDAFGEAIEVSGTGLLARCLQHETDHLNGIVFGERLSGRARKKLYALHGERADNYPSDWPVTPRVDSESVETSDQRSR